MGLLRRAADIWNQTDPRIVSGFDMDAQAAEAALAVQPIGTFVCRLCMRQAGCLVLSCKVIPAHTCLWPCYTLDATAPPHRVQPCVVLNSYDCCTEEADPEKSTRMTGCSAMQRRCLSECVSVLWLQVDPSTASTDASSNVMHVTISAADLRRSDPSQLVLSLPYASHMLDVGTGFRIDKRTVLPGHQVSITLAFGMLAVQAAVSDTSTAPRAGGGHKRPLEELAVQAADSAVRSVQREAAAAKRRRDGEAAPVEDTPQEGLEMMLVPPRGPGRQPPADALPRHASHSEFTRWAAHSTMSNSGM